MKTIVINLSDAEYKALSVLNSTPEEWAIHAVKNKARKMINDLVESNSDKQPRKMLDQEKESVILGVDIAKEKKKRHIILKQGV